jgi:hypothetical protein
MIKRKEFSTHQTVQKRYISLFGNVREDTRCKYDTEVSNEALDFINNHKIISINEYKTRNDNGIPHFYIVIYFEE